MSSMKPSVFFWVICWNKHLALKGEIHQFVYQTWQIQSKRGYQEASKIEKNAGAKNLNYRRALKTESFRQDFYQFQKI